MLMTQRSFLPRRRHSIMYVKVHDASRSAWLTKVEGDVMRTQIAKAAILATGLGAMVTSAGAAESSGTDAEIALLKQQVRLLEQKLDRLEKQGAARSKGAASAKAEPKSAEPRPAAPTATAVIPAKAPIPWTGAVVPSDVVVTMP